MTGHDGRVSSQDEEQARWLHSRGLVDAPSLQAALTRRRQGDPRSLGALLEASGHPAAAGALRARASERLGAVPCPTPEVGRPLLLRPGLEVAVERILGEGGMGVVYLVRDPALGRLAALKLARPGGAPRRVLRFQRARAVTARLDHPGIPPVYEAGQLAGGQDWLLMRYVEGRSLGELLRARQAPGPGRELLRALATVARAVAYAHNRGVVHRDLKPDNVMVGAFGEVLVMDWGLARDLGQSEGEDRGLRHELVSEQEGPAAALTREGALIGTLGYMAPEQARGEDVDARADVFALGAILTDVLTDAPPFEGQTAGEVLARTVAGDVVRPAARRRGVPPELDAIAARALHPLRHARYPSAAAFADDLEAWLEDRPVAAHRYGPRERLLRAARRHPVAAVAACLVLAALLAIRYTRATTAAQARAAALSEAAGRARAAEAALGTTSLAGLEGRSPEERHLELEQRIAATLAALSAAGIWHTLAPADPEAGATRARVALALAGAASADGQWSLAGQALEEAARAGVDPARTREAREALDAAQNAEARRRGEELEALLDQAEAGALQQRPEGAREAVFRIVRLAHPDVVARLAGRLERTTAELERVEREAWGEVATQTEGERAAGEEALEGLLAALARQAALPPGGRPEPADAELLRRAAARLERRQTRREFATTEARGRRAAAILAGRQRDALGARLEAARVMCEALGWLGDRGAVPALGRYLRAEQDETRAAAAGAALCRLGGEAAQAYVVEGRRRFGQVFHLATQGAPAGVVGERAGSGLDAAAALLEAGEPERALAEVERLLAASPEDPGILRLHGRCLDRLGRQQEAEAAFGAALAQAPGDAGLWTARAEKRIALQQHREAMSDLDEALRLDPGLAHAWYLRSFARAMLGETEGAVLDATRAIEADPDLASAWYLRGTLRGSLGHLPPAIEDLERAEALSPAMEGAVRNRAALLLNAHQWSRAEQAYTRLLELQPDDREGLLRRARARREQGDLAGARADLDRLLQREPAHVEALSARGWLRALGGDASGGHEDLDRAVALAPDQAAPLAERGGVALVEGRLLDARRDLEASLAIEPKQAPAWGNLGEALSGLGELPAALEAFDRALALDLSLIGGWTGRGRTRSQLGDHARAWEDLRRALALAPDDARVRLNAGVVLMNARRFAEAEPHLVRVTELIPGDYRGWGHLGDCRASQGRPREALVAYDRALQGQPQDASLWTARGAARLAADDRAGARSDLERARALDPRAAGLSALEAKLGEPPGR